MILHNRCYELLRLAIRANLAFCKVYLNDTYIATCSFICQPLILGIYIRLILLLPNSINAERITSLLLYDDKDILLTVPISQNINISRLYNSVLNIRLKLGA